MRTLALVFAMAIAVGVGSAASASPLPSIDQKRVHADSRHPGSLPYGRVYLLYYQPYPVYSYPYYGDRYYGFRRPARVSQNFRVF
jgi:hypothetical protein